PRRRHPGAHVGDRLAHRARSAVPRRAHRRCAARSPRPRRRRDRVVAPGQSRMTSLAGIRVVELASEQAAWAGKLLADLGADVVVVEPPGGHHSRGYGPFLDDEPGPERSLFWWHSNTSKRSVVLDLDQPDDAARFRELAG